MRTGATVNSPTLVSAQTHISTVCVNLIHIYYAREKHESTHDEGSLEARRLNSDPTDRYEQVGIREIYLSRYQRIFHHSIDMAHV